MVYRQRCFLYAAIYDCIVRRIFANENVVAWGLRRLRFIREGLGDYRRRLASKRGGLLHSASSFGLATFSSHTAVFSFDAMTVGSLLALLEDARCSRLLISLSSFGHGGLNLSLGFGAALHRCFLNGCSGVVRRLQIFQARESAWRHACDCRGNDSYRRR